MLSHALFAWTRVLLTSFIPAASEQGKDVIRANEPRHLIGLAFSSDQSEAARLMLDMCNWHAIHWRGDIFVFFSERISTFFMFLVTYSNVSQKISSPNRSLAMSQCFYYRNASSCIWKREIASEKRVQETILGMWGGLHTRIILKSPLDAGCALSIF